MHGHIPVLSQCWEGLCGSLAKEEWQGNDGRRGSERASYHLICGAWVGGLEGREIIKMPRVKAILSLEPISLRNCLPESVFMPPALHYKAADSRVWRLLFTWAHVGLNCGSNRFHLEVIRDISGSQWLWLGTQINFLPANCSLRLTRTTYHQIKTPNWRGHFFFVYATTKQSISVSDFCSPKGLSCERWIN